MRFHAVSYHGYEPWIHIRHRRDVCAPSLILCRASGRRRCPVCCRFYGDYDISVAPSAPFVPAVCKDGLTDLNNRRTFLQLAQKRLDGGNAGVLILFDADHFKRINDKWGHAVGDRCLIEIAYRLKWNLRPSDVAGRIGGEEFAVLLSNATLHEARVIGWRIGQPIPFRAVDNGPHLSVALSMGAAEIAPGIALDTHLIRADEALYLAKSKERARMVVWEPRDKFEENAA